MSNSTCDLTYSAPIENIKYAAQVAYLFPPAILYARILWVIWRKHRNVYTKHQFFVIYSMDSVVGLLSLLVDILITRLFVYIPQLCPIASNFFLTHTLFIDIYYPLLNHLHCAQPLIQIFLTTNRASSVIWPINHNQWWAEKRGYIIGFILVSPFLVIWNSIISPKVVVFYFGGFFMKSLKLVPWASMSLFLFLVRSVAVVITIFSTIVMFSKMSKMKKRLKASEKTLCVACAIHSVCFLIPSFFEALAFFYPPYGTSWINYLIQPFAWDVLNVGSPIIMIFVSSQLRAHVFPWRISVVKRSDTNTSLHVASMTN